MDASGDQLDARARAALRNALDGSSDWLMGVALRAAPAERPDDDPESEMNAQFLHAFAALMVEALDGDGRAMRDLVFESAIPAMIAHGQDAMTLLEGHVAFFVVLSRHLVEAMPAELADAAERWLAAYFAGYAREVTERAQAIEQGAR